MLTRLRVIGISGMHFVIEYYNRMQNLVNEFQAVGQSISEL